MLRYYKLGLLKNLEFEYEKGFESIGTETHYDQEGNIIKTIDHRQADIYPICFKEAISILEKKISKNDSILSIEREKEFIPSKKDTLYSWKLYSTNLKNRKTSGYRMNAATGKIIKKWKVVSYPD